MFNDHCSRASGDIKYFNFLITSKNILIEVSSTYEWEFFRVRVLPGLATVGIMIVEVRCF